MSKIIKITEEIIYIGDETGTVKEVRPCDISFEAVVGDEVDLFQSSTETIVSKTESKKEELPTSGININVNSGNAGMEYMGNGKKAVNKMVYCLLALFIGGIGAHKFYSGRIGTGVVYLLFMWTLVPAFIAFIEFIIAVCQKADSNGNILV